MTNSTIDISGLDTIEPGLIGVCDLIHRLMAAQGYEGDLDELRLISGAAVQHYLFDPAYNRHEEERREYSRLALLFNNYGFYESLRYFTGWNVRDFDRVSLPDVFRLAEFELSQGRPLVSADLRGEVQPALLIGMEKPRKLRALVRSAGGGTRSVTLDLTGQARLQTDEAFENFFVIVRQAEDADEALVGPNRQRFELLRWIVRHHRAEKEFFHETRENYAPGDRGYQRLEELVRVDSADVADYLADHLGMLSEGRTTASRVLSRWAVMLSELRDEEKLERLLNAASVAYGEVAALLGDDPDIAAARRFERDAVALIEEAFVYFPGRFEPLD